METGRLLAIQQPSKVDTLLQSFVWSVDILPDGARRLHDRSELSSVHQHLVIKAKKKAKAWAAWTDDYRTWVFAAEMSLPLSRERGQPVLLVDAYGDDGNLIESACWVAARNGQWSRCAG